MRKWALLLALVGSLSPTAASAQREYLEQISLDSLLQVEVSTASRYAQRVQNSPAVVSIVTAQEIERFGDRTLEQLLSRLAGFYTSYDRNYTYLGVRGFSRPTDYNNRVLLLLNGRMVNEPFYGMAPVGTDLPIDLGLVERVEVVRGPGSALWGGGAMLAVINIVTRSADELDGVGGSFEYGAGRARDAAVRVGARAGGVEVIAGLRAGNVDGGDVHFPEFADPASNDGWAEGLDWDRYRGGVALLRWRGFQAQLLATHRRKGIPAASWSSAFNDPREQTLDRYGLAELRYDARPADAIAISAAVHASGYHYRGGYPIDELYLDATDTRSAGASAQATIDLHAANRLLAGAEWSHHRRADYRLWGETSGEQFFDGDFPYRAGAVFLQDEQSLGERATVTLGLRRDINSRAPDSWSPRAALVLRPTGRTTVRALYGSAFRVPTIYEREYYDLTFRRSEGLAPERIRTAELALDQRAGPVFARGSVFHYRMDDLIETVIDDEGVSTFVNRSSASALGGELDLAAELPHLRLHARYTAVAVRDGADAELSNAPAHLLKLGASAALRDTWTAAADLQYGSSRNTIAGTELDGALVLDLNLAAHRLLPGVDFGVRLRNALSARYATPAGAEHVQAAIPQDGRRIYIFAAYHR